MKKPRDSAPLSEHSRVTVYVPGRTLSLRDTENLLSSMQAAVIWSAYVKLPHPHGHSAGEPYPVAWNLRESFECFLASKYEPTRPQGNFERA